MPFDSRIIEAKLALGLIGPEEMPALAWDALEAGFDGPSVCRLAALISPSGWETDQIAPAFMAEAGLQRISQGEAAMRLAQQLAHRILSEGLDPLDYSKDFYALYIRAGYPRAIQEVGFLDDQKYVAECMGQSEAEIRKDARTALLALISSADTKPQN